MAIEQDRAVADAFCKGRSGKSERRLGGVHVKTLGSVAVAAMLAVGATSVTAGARAVGAPRQHRAKHAAPGESMTTLENSGFIGEWSAGLNPLTAPSNVVQASIMKAIYGQLFQLRRCGRGRQLEERTSPTRAGPPHHSGRRLPFSGLPA